MLVLASLKSARPSSKLLLAAALVAFVGFVVVVVIYGWGNVLANLVGGFVASLAAFVLALSWERDRELQERDRELRRLKGAAEEQQARRTTEVRRRFASVRAELERNAQSLRDLKIDPRSIEAPEFVYLHPQLLEGAWTANAPRLSELVADYELVADLAFTYGRLQELRWRLRHRSELRTKELDRMTAPLVDKRREEVADLVERVRVQVDEPTVRPLGLVHTRTGSLTARVSTAALIETEVIRGSDSTAEEPGETARPRASERPRPARLSPAPRRPRIATR